MEPGTAKAQSSPGSLCGAPENQAPSKVQNGPDCNCSPAHPFFTTSRNSPHLAGQLKGMVSLDSIEPGFSIYQTH
jgi:hypothetical protein